MGAKGDLGVELDLDKVPVREESMSAYEMMLSESQERMLMVLGVDEACTNVIRYAYRLRDDQLISLRMEGLRKCVRLRLRDYGDKVFPHEMKGRSHDLIKPGGLGLHLIRYAFDRVDYIHKPRGTELVLTKNLA